MKKLILLFCIVIFHISIFAQVTPSLYAGFGTGTNLGGSFGLGTEIRNKIVSFNGAVGSWMDKLPAHTGAQSRFDYDFGVKIYSKYGLYLGTNYGIIDEALYTKAGQDLLHFEKIHGLSFTVGYRKTIYKNIFGLTYFGLTSNKRANTLAIMDNKSFAPRIGIIFGIDLIKNRK